MSLWDKIRTGLKKTTDAVSDKFENVISSFNHIDEDMLEQLMEIMILADMGYVTANNICDRLRIVAKKNPENSDLKTILKQVIFDEMGETIHINADNTPLVILVIGVNGVGKTTSIGKLANKFTMQGKSVILAAADTFRAGAAEQLSIWAKRANCMITKHQDGADPSAVVFDCISSAKSKNIDVIIIDTAGRLHNKKNLMQELAKISRIIDKEMPNAFRENILIVDGTTGQNAINQALEFSKVTNINAIAITKLDGTAKGGMAVALSGIAPIKLAMIGEKIDDIIDFDKKQFIDVLIGE